MTIPEALVAFLEAPTWGETRRVLEKQRHVLLSEQAIAFLRRKIDERRFHPDYVQMVQDMEIHLHLLEDARTYGIETAWDRFVQARETDFGSVFQALGPFLQAPTWRESERILKEQQHVLLSDQAITFLRSMIDKTRREPNSLKEVQGLEAHLHLLEDARTMGVEQVWQKFQLARFQEMLQSQERRQHFEELLQIVAPGDLDKMRSFLSLYQQNPDEFARQMGTTKDDPTFLWTVEYFRRRVGG